MVYDDGASKGIRRKGATIADVAETAGVAIGTVSRFLNGRALRRGKREQIEAAIAKLSYRRNALAAAMKTNRTHVVGLLIPTFDDFHAMMVERLAALIRTTGRALLMYCHNHEPRVVDEALDFFAAQRADALVMDGIAGVQHRVQRLMAEGVPIVFYNNDMPGLSADCVMVENEAASRRAVGHLLDLGHERIAVVTGDLQDSSGRYRLEGYQQALRERGIPAHPGYVVRGTWHADSGSEAIGHLLGLKRPPTAVFLSNYRMTVGALGWMKERGLRAPDHLSLVSFDDVPLFRLHEPGITAVAQPISGIAESILALLTTRLDPSLRPPRRSIVLDCDVILRGSTRRAAARTMPEAERLVR